VFRIVAITSGESFVGPFVLNRSHPLSAGLSLDGVIWGATRQADAAGLPLITAANVALLSDLERPGGRHELWLNFNPDLSTLQNSPNWPILFWNLLDWRGSKAPGIREPNVRLGDSSIITTLPEVTSVVLESPDGTTREIPATDRRAVVSAEQPGVYKLRAGNEEYEFAANALRREESDLSRLDSGSWGDPAPLSPEEIESRGIAWLFLLVAMLVLGAHVMIAARSPSPAKI
jgi:hypothetical protein